MSILRLLFVVLLLLNLLALAAAFGLLGSAAPRGEPERLTNQLQPEHIQLRGTGDSAPAPAAPQAAPRPEAPLPRAAEATPAPAPLPAPAEAQTAPESCLAFAGLGGDAADAVVRAFDAPEFSVRRSASEAITGWWVRIPPDGTREYAERKGRELRALGVTEFFIVQEPGPNQYAVSLGLFKTEAAANQHLERLRNLRVRSASVGSRTATTYLVEVRGAQTLLDERRRTAQLPAAAQAAGCAP